MDKRVSEAIETVLAENTFAPDALKAMQSKLDAVRDIEDQNSVLENEIERLRKEVSGKDVRIAELMLRADQVEGMAEKNAGAKIENAADKARADTLEKCFELVFRNSEIRRSAFQTSPVVRSFGDGQPDYVESHQHSTDTVEETK